jgi:hypothetical protein
MPAFNYISQAGFLTQLGSRLYDQQSQFWSAAEKRLYLADALRTWQALTGYWRSEFIFPTANNTTFYDLTAVANTLRAYTLRDSDIYLLTQYHLLEPSVGVNPWTGVSTQFSASDLLDGLTRRRNEAVSLAGCTITRRTTPAIAGRIALPDTVLDVRRIAYLPNAIFSQPNSVLWPEDAFAEQAFNRNYLQAAPGTPSSYLLSTQPPLTFDVDVPPAFIGNYELLTVEALAAFTAATPSPLNIPDDFAFVLRFGLLADLFNREGNSKDALRAKHCEQLYRMGLAALGDAPALLQLRVNNVPVQLDAIRDADTYQTGWQAQAAAQPSAAFIAGLNMVALSPTPDAGAYSVTASVVQNAPIPASDADFVQCGRDVLDAILDYCVHLAMIKVGGAELLDTMTLVARFMSMAQAQNRKLMQNAEYNSVLYAMSQREESRNPRMTPPADAPVEAANG